MITVENEGQFHTSNYTIGVIPYNPEFTDDGVSKEQIKGKRPELYKDLTDLPLIDKATYDKLEEQIQSTKINHPILMGRK